MTGVLSLATYGTPAQDAPLIWEGYTSAAGDGGQGVLDGNNGNFSILPSNQFQVARNLKLHNTGTAPLVTTWTGNNWNLLDACEFDTCSNAAAITMGSNCRVSNCNFGSGLTGGMSLSIGAGSTVIGCWFAAGYSSQALSTAGNECFIARNIFNVPVSANGLRINNNRGHVIEHNSFRSAGSGTGAGISIEGSSADGAVVRNNLFVGFSGTGGKDIAVASGAYILLWMSNASYNITSPESGTNAKLDGGDNETLVSNPFAESGANTFANRFIYFAPQDVGNVHGGAYTG